MIDDGFVGIESAKHVGVFDRDLLAVNLRELVALLLRLVGAKVAHRDQPDVVVDRQ